MKNATKIVASFVLLFTLPISAQTTLTVTSGSATLDGTITVGEYTSTTLVTALGVELNAMDDGQYLYLAASWADTTESIDKKQWFYNGSTWTQSGNEDRIAFMWDMGLNDPEGVNCALMCHPPIMNTSVGKVDIWHWKAHRGNPMGFADDKYFNEVLGGDGGRHGDAGTSTYSDNGPDTSDLPEFMAISDPGANVDFLVNTDGLANFDPYGVISGTFAEAITFNQVAVFSNGNIIPGYVLRNGEGDRGDVKAAGKWEAGVWTVEFRRKNSGSDNDFAVTSGSSVDFTHEIFDDEGGSHANNGFDATVYTLDFSNIIVSIEGQTTEQLPEAYSLDQNYPNPFNPATTITYAVPHNSFISLRVIDILGNEVQTLVNEIKNAGTYTINFDAANVPSGVYFYTLEAGSFVTTKKMVLIK
jgi:hypothetical protein